MHLKNKIKSLLLFSLIILMGCSKKKEIKPSVNLLLTNRAQKTWILQSTIVNGSETLHDCEKDNEWTFNDNNTVLQSSGFLRCDLYEKDLTLKYFLGGPNNESIYFTVKDSTYDRSGTTSYFYRIEKAEIVELDESSLKYEQISYSEWGDQVDRTTKSFRKK